jgi:NADH dehydrogenase [ubiquinone] 1 alpha subcomplex assembly factor 7
VTPLAALIRRQIETGGPLPVSEYMALALGHAEFGYYARRDPMGLEPLGWSGDFITAPEISQVFGELLAAWCVGVWRAMGSPRPIMLAELGPGRGTLLIDLWRAASTVAGDFAAALRLHLVETSQTLRAAQKVRLSATPFPAPPRWHEHIHDLPPGPMLLIANEFLDALPVEQYVRDAGAWRQRQVAINRDADRFAFALGDVVNPLQRPDLADLPEASDGEMVERCPEAERLVARVAERLAGHGGAALFIDYGPARSGPGETFQAIRGHRRADPLVDPGEIDLSHHVDFERLAVAALSRHARCWGPVPQGLFLGRLGIAERVGALMKASPAQAEAIEGAARRLVHPGRMGLLFKALAVGHPALPTPPGFAATD